MITDEQFYKLVNKEIFDKGMRALRSDTMNKFMDVMIIAQERKPDPLKHIITSDEVLDYALEKLITKMRAMQRAGHEAADKMEEAFQKGDMKTFHEIVDSSAEGLRNDL